MASGLDLDGVFPLWALTGVLSGVGRHLFMLPSEQPLCISPPNKCAWHNPLVFPGKIMEMVTLGNSFSQFLFLSPLIPLTCKSCRDRVSLT